MDSKNTITLMAIVLPLIGGAVGYMIKQGVEKKKELLSEATRERRQLYQQFIDLVIDLFGSTKPGMGKEAKDALPQLFDFYKKYVLYASPEVINAFSDYFQLLYQSKAAGKDLDHRIHIRKLSRIMLEMRRDLGLPNKNLGSDGENLFRALITDFDTLVK